MLLINKPNGNYTARQLKLPLEIEKLIDISDPVYTFCEVRDHIDLSGYLKAPSFATFGNFIRNELTDTIEQIFADVNAYIFGGIAPTYHIELLDKPTIVWDFHSLMLAIQMMFSFMITDENSTLKLCKHCGKIFVASRSNVQFCSSQCKNQHNVYKCRAKEDAE